MTSRSKWLLIGALVVSVAVNLFFVAGIWHHRQRMQGAPGPLAALPEQAKPAFRQMVEGQRRVVREAAPELRQANRELWRELARPGATLETLRPKMDAAIEGRAAIRRKQMEDLFAFAQTLPPEERARFAERMAERAERIGGRGAP